MNFVSRQAAIGAVVAASLMLGAGAGPITQPGAPPYAAPTIGAQESVAVLREHVAVVAGRILDIMFDDALDVFAQFAARLKQL